MAISAEVAAERGERNSYIDVRDDIPGSRKFWISGLWLRSEFVNLGKQTGRTRAIDRNGLGRHVRGGISARARHRRSGDPGLWVHQ